jgi:ketosteroid isomerase-like protein
MKKTLFVLIMAISSHVFAQTADEEAIKKVIVGEFDAYINRDFQAWIDYYVDSPQNAYMITPGSGAGQLVYRTGFETMKNTAQKQFETPIKGLFDIVKREDWNFRILGNFAWVSYKSTFKVGTIMIPAAELKVFEKIDGQWKISATASIGDYKNATPPIKSSY